VGANSRRKGRDIMRADNEPTADAPPTQEQEAGLCYELLLLKSNYDGYDCNSAFDVCIAKAQSYDRELATLRRQNDLLASTLQASAYKVKDHMQAEAELDKTRAEAHALHRERIGEVWYWQNDEYDHLDSLTCPVLIEANDLRELVALRARLETTESALREAIDAMKLYVLPPSEHLAIVKRSEAALTPEPQAKCKHVPPSEPRWFPPCPKCGYCSPDISQQRHGRAPS
jgi:hypothetical protein